LSGRVNSRQAFLKYHYLEVDTHVNHVAPANYF
jgi:hypothetical protein